MAEEKEKEKKIGYYLLGKTIGEGTFGKVKLATHTLTGEKVAIKILEKAKILENEEIERINREIKFLKKLKNPSLLNSKMKNLVVSKSLNFQLVKVMERTTPKRNMLIK
mgnify:CR=1 FL=1